VHFQEQNNHHLSKNECTHSPYFVLLGFLFVLIFPGTFCLFRCELFQMYHKTHHRAPIVSPQEAGMDIRKFFGGKKSSSSSGSGSGSGFYAGTSTSPSDDGRSHSGGGSGNMKPANATATVVAEVTTDAPTKHSDAKPIVTTAESKKRKAADTSSGDANDHMNERRSSAGGHPRKPSSPSANNKDNTIHVYDADTTSVSPPLSKRAKHREGEDDRSKLVNLAVAQDKDTKMDTSDTPSGTGHRHHTTMTAALVVDVDSPSPASSPSLASISPTKQSQRGSNYRAYLSRPPPPKQGQKDLPCGPRDCLRGKEFVITGVLDSLTREDAQDLIERHGGIVAKSVTKKVTHAIVGLEAGPAKLAKIEQRKIKVMTEDDLLNMIRAAGPRPDDYHSPPSTSATTTETLSRPQHHPQQSSPVMKIEVIEDDDDAVHGVIANTSKKGMPNFSSASPTHSTSTSTTDNNSNNLLWTDKYAPTSSSQVIGNGSNVQQLKDWLQSWYVGMGSQSSNNNSGSVMKRSSSSSQSPRACLITGPPGLGKTTAATLVCAECGYISINMNASDTRSKSTIRETIAEMLGTHGLTEYFAGQRNNNNNKRTVLIMDEVDGMSSGDRGGLSELIQLIKDTKIPIICIANDRYKVRSLEPHCAKIVFRRPSHQQILARLTQIAHREGLSIDPVVLRRLADAAHGDVRHAVHVLQYWSVGKDPSIDTIRDELHRGGKNLTLGPFDAAPQLLSVNAGTRLTDQLEAFFVDHSLLPLFIYENYLGLAPGMPQEVSSRPPAVQQAFVARQISRASDSISLGDVLAQSIRREQHWELLPGLGAVSTVRPAMCTASHFRGGPIQFPQWLGKNSTALKRQRMVSDLQLQTTLTTAGVTSRALRLDVAYALADELVRPLVSQGSDGITTIISTMDAYGITKDGRDALFEVITLPSAPGSASISTVLDSIPSTLKAALTRAYNKSSHKVTSAGRVSHGKGRKRVGAVGEPTAVVGPDGELAMVASDEDVGVLGGDGGDDGEGDVEGDGHGNDGETADGLITSVTPTKSKAKAKGKATGGSKKKKGAEVEGTSGEKPPSGKRKSKPK
jgi:replication factor C subunit 1